MRTFLMIVVILLVSSVAYGDDKEIKNIRVKKAKTVREKEAEKAKEEYFEKLKKLKAECKKKLDRIDEKYKTVLRKELKSETQKGNLGEALAIKKEMEGLQNYKEKKVEKKEDNSEIINTLCDGKWGPKKLGKGLFKFYKDGSVDAWGKKCKWEIKKDSVVISDGSKTEKMMLPLNPDNNKAVGTGGKVYIAKQYK